MSAHDVKMFGDQIAASRLESRFAQVKATSLIRLVIEDLYPGRVALVSSFGADAAALLHMVSRVDKGAPVIFVDTGQHFPETLAYRDQLAHDARPHERDRRRAARGNDRGGGSRRSFCSPAIRTGAARSAKFARSPKRWRAMTPGSPGAKASRAQTRATLPLFEAEGERVKINPLVGWSATDILNYISEAGLPRHPLVAKGFPSIGCLPCTSPVKPGEDERAGRWRGRGKAECGIHVGVLDAGADI